MFEQLQKNIHYRFKNESLLVTAMTHSSYTNEHKLTRMDCNERLEYLGDAVLELSSSEFIFNNYPEYPEGEMSKLRASIVCEPTLADVAEQIGIRPCLLLGRGEEATGGRSRASVTSDALEALIGAIYLDSGFDAAKKFVWTFIMNDIENKKLFYDSKTILQELVQNKNLGTLEYRLVSAEGPDHARTFVSEALVGGKVYGTGKGRNKKLSEQGAAYQAILALK